MLNNFLVVILLLSMSIVNAGSYLSDKKDAFVLNNLINVLVVQQQELQRLMSMLEVLETMKASLSKRNVGLGEQGELLQLDEEKVENGEITNSEFKGKGASTQYANRRAEFQTDVEKFNVAVKEYNVLTVKMDHVLNKRSPSQVRQLIKEMRQLVENLQDALQAKNIIKAKFIAKQSVVAVEFGYVAN